MLNIIHPAFTSEIVFDCWMSFMGAFINAMSNLQIMVNDTPTNIATSAGTFLNTYSLSGVNITLKTNSNGYGFKYANNGTYYYDGCVIQISPLFIDTNYMLLSTNGSTGNKVSFSSLFNSIGFSTVDLNNNNGYGFNAHDSTTKQNALILNMPNYGSSIADMKDAIILTYNTDNIAYLSVYDASNYIIFAKLNPIDPADDPLYMIISRIQNRDDKAIYFITKDQVYDGTPFAEPLEIISSDLQLSDTVSDEILIHRFEYNDRWYSDDLYVVNYVSDDHPTIINGAQYVPLGFNLFLKAK